MDILPTKYKCKISKDFSYPIGAQLLSDIFSGIKQYNNLELSFYGRGEFWASDFNKALKDQGDILILRINYENNRPGFSASKSRDDYYKEHWHLKIYAVPRQVRHIVKTELLKKFLPKGRNWLINRYENKRNDYYKFEVFFNLKSSKFTVIESEDR